MIIKLLTTIRTIYWYSFFTITLILSTPILLYLKIRKSKITEEERKNIAYNFASKFSLMQIKNSGSKIHVKGIENIPNTTILFVSNHQSNFDIAIFLAYIGKQKSFVAKKELKKIPILSSWMKSINCIFMDRNDMKQSLKAILEGIKMLEDGHSLVIFPEGTRSKDKKMTDFKPGSFKLATKSKVPIVPVTIDGSSKIMEDNNMKIKPNEVYVTIHKPIKTSDITKEEEIALPKKVYKIIEDTLN